MTSAAKPTDGLSPAMRQYMEMKALHPEGLLFFQMGDFYELFFEDAEKAAPLLEIALTSRSKKGDQPIPMCGVPLSAGIMYANRLTRQGLQVVLANQVGDPGAKGIIERAVMRIGTPGVPLDDDTAAAGEPHYLAAICPGPGGYGLAGLEVSTGDFLLARFGDLEALRAEFLSLGPHECLLPQHAAPELLDVLRDMRVYATHLPPERMDALAALDRFRELFGAHAAAAWDLDEFPEALSAAGAVLDYAESCSRGGLDHLAPPRLLWNQAHLVLDEAALANLEILKTLRHGQLEGSLLGLMDRTATPMGSRLMRQWLSRPLRDAAEISARHGAVEEFLRDGLSRDALSGLLKKTSDLERALGRVVLKHGGPRDLAALRDSLFLIPEYKKLLSRLNSVRLATLGEALPDFGELTSALMNRLEEHPPVNAKDGGLIKRGVSPELDELLDLEKGGKSGILALEARERERTGINSLKVGFNRVFGYYLEVTKTNLANVPSDWIRKQTIAGGERYLTPELKEWEEKILHAGERRLALEEQLFEELKELVAAQARPIKEAAQLLA
ncbi:MAG: DNA mismatch repair protein MutS, partial [Candidatus Adiutrix sp.]|nr:DNA mismatch repair protein MutS [Candidatus Adiutrix sp.]